MGAIANALPQAMHSLMNARGQYSPTQAHGMQSLHDPYRVEQQGWPIHRSEPMAMARAAPTQQLQYSYPPYATFQSQPSQTVMPQMHSQEPCSPVSIQGCNLALQQADPRFMQMGGHARCTGMGGDFTHYAQRGRESALAPAPAPAPAPVPSFPRGPPRKPKQSGHALWVGNLPPAAKVEDLKDHFSRDATKDIESLFLISKSNCAFVNYRSEAACTAAMNRFHDSRFHGVRLVCRLRRGCTASSGPSSRTSIGNEVPKAALSSDSDADSAYSAPQDPDTPTIVCGSYERSTSEKSAAAASNCPTARRVPERYFVIKSLTVQDLESSVRNGIWATQNHNESLLNQAFRDSDKVYLIFSANKSGEYFGYAWMTSATEGEPVDLNVRSRSNEPVSLIMPHATPTPATATAPKGHIVDDSARGTIFWEAGLSDEDEDEVDGAKYLEERKTLEGHESTPGSDLGRQFSIEWISTARLPFYRTRGLRNPFNANREVKIARDGTELEPSVGRRIVQMFHQSPPNSGSQHMTMPYR